MRKWLSILLFSLCFSIVAPSVAAERSIVIVTVERLNVRSGPALTFPIQTKITKGERYVVLDKKGKWFQIQLSNNQSGWVSADYVNIEKAGNTVVCEANQLRLRQGPGLNFSIIGYIVRGEKGIALQQKGEWVKVQWNGKEGWVHRAYISFVDKLAENRYVHVLYDKTNIRAAASTEAPIIMKAKRNDTFPIVRKEGQWYVIQVNERTTGYIAEWVVKTSDQQIEEQTIHGKTIVIDAGHGGKDYGTTGAQGTREKALTLATAKLLQTKLQALGANVILTREDDTFRSLSERVMLAHQTKADAFISIHYDSSLSRSANGLTVYYYKEKDRLLAQSLSSQLSRLSYINHRGIRFGDYHVLRENNRRSVLLELGYLSNPTEEQIITSANYQQEVTEAICRGLVDYFEK
ncbi:N-acetylmuramoyl-L-alanine amidase [Thermolongibacillus altinsuensis]|uniref:N-acetylmuramoyl-L-alanine amidase n=1 Tax=Thermolongibacillus altinsuensis TaxID=575256 RepID=UPI00242A30E4|nr:N-acetylmuramoyl-L-alanine amidase [Thermolongibacillus altinsuensis]GMB07509.1 putative N-acetylmuramoyl-L-alanine amidase YrvJ [Thermolongibacillus altinsuensis]